MRFLNITRIYCSQKFPQMKMTTSRDSRRTIDEMIKNSMFKLIFMILGNRCNHGFVMEKDSTFSLGTFSVPSIGVLIRDLLQPCIHNPIYVDLILETAAAAVADDDQQHDPVLLERWHIHYEPKSSSSSMSCRRSVLYSRLLVLVRILSSITQLLPISSVSDSLSHSIQFKIYTDDTHRILFDRPAHSFSFHPIHTDRGILRLSVYYRPDLGVTRINKSLTSASSSLVRNQTKIIAQHATKSSRPIPIRIEHHNRTSQNIDIPFGSSLSRGQYHSMSSSSLESSSRYQCTPPVLTNSCSLRWTPPSFGNCMEGYQMYQHSLSASPPSPSVVYGPSTNSLAFATPSPSSSSAPLCTLTSPDAISKLSSMLDHIHSVSDSCIQSCSSSSPTNMNDINHRINQHKIWFEQTFK